MDEEQKPPVEEQTPPGSTAKLIRRVRKATERRFTAEEKIRIVLEGLGRTVSI